MPFLFSKQSGWIPLLEKGAGTVIRSLSEELKALVFIRYLGESTVVVKAKLKSYSAGPTSWESLVNSKGTNNFNTDYIG